MKMKSLKAKLNKQGGFTLIEMLIVVAIIAILVAISIPMVNSALEKARDATDQANERAAKAEAVIKYLGVEDDLTNPGATNNTGDFWYDAKDGKLVKQDAGATKPATYGKCKGASGCYIPAGESAVASNENKLIQVNIASNGEITLKWVS